MSSGWPSTPRCPRAPTPQGVAQVIVAKHRNGPTGAVELRFRQRLAKFEDWVLQPEDGDLPPEGIDQ